MKPPGFAKVEKTFALVVGIAEYPKWRDFKLEGAVEDAYLITEWLLRRKVPKDQIRLFLSPLDREKLKSRKIDELGLTLADVQSDVANSSTIDAFIREQLTDYRDAELLFLFWVGHGVIEVDHYPRLFYADASPKNPECIDLHSLTEALRSRAFESFHHQIVIVDACQKYAEKLLKPPVKVVESRFTAGEAKFRPQFQLFSTQPGMPAAALNSDDEKSFGYQLRKHLSEAVETQPDVWPPDMEAVAERIQKAFIDLQADRRSPQVPQFKCVHWRGGGTDDLRETPALGRRTGEASGHVLAENRRPMLIDRLRALGALDAERRAAIIQALPQAMDVLPVDSGNFFERLLDVSLSWPGGLEALTESLHAYDAGDPSLQALYTTLDAFFPQAVNWTEVGELKRLLAGQSPTGELWLPFTLSAATSRSTPWDLCRGRQPIYGLLDWLALCTSHGGSGVPLLDFVEQNKSEFPPVLQARLEDWTGRVAARFPGRKKAQETPSARSADSPSLLVRVVPKAKDPERGQLYELQGWLANAPGLSEGVTPTVTPPVNTTTFAGISAVIEDMRVNALRLLNYDSVAMTVEIFMPRKLRAGQEACDLDRLNKKLGEGLEKPLNVEYTLVYRSEERAYEPRMEGTWDVWRARWKKRPVPPLNADDSHLICLDDFKGKSRVLLLDRLRKGGPVCLSPFLSPGEGMEVETLSRLDLLLASGTPIAVWRHRPVEDIPSAMSALRTLVCGALGDPPPLPSLDKLPVRVRESREEAWVRRLESEESGTPPRDENPLILLWDNPFLLPKDVEEPGQFEQPV